MASRCFGFLRYLGNRTLRDRLSGTTTTSGGEAKEKESYNINAMVEAKASMERNAEAQLKSKNQSRNGIISLVENASDSREGWKCSSTTEYAPRQTLYFAAEVLVLDESRLDRANGTCDYELGWNSENH